MGSVAWYQPAPVATRRPATTTDRRTGPPSFSATTITIATTARARTRATTRSTRADIDLRQPEPKPVRAPQGRERLFGAASHASPAEVVGTVEAWPTSRPRPRLT